MIVCLLTLIETPAQENNLTVRPAKIQQDRLEDAMKEAWKISWSRFYHRRTGLFYDYITSYRTPRSLAHLPTREEVAREYPNSYGYDTGMEDCMISAGVMLAMVVDRFDVTGDKRLADRAEEIVDGIRRTATAHGSPGFVARGLNIDRSQSSYPSTSRDQVTHAVHGLWYYYNSALSTESSRDKVRSLLAAIASRMERNVTPENNYDFLRPDESCEPIGLQRMWDVGGHEAARLPMIYAAAWNATGLDSYYDLYRKYIRDAVTQSKIPVSHVSTWGLLQMQASFELLGSLEEDPSLKASMEEIMHTVALECRRRADKAWHDGQSLDLTTLAKDWRRPDGGIKSNGSYRRVWYCIRQSGESALAQVIAGADDFPDEQRRLLEQAILRLDYNRVSSNGIFYLQAAYWKSRKLKIY